MNSDVIAWIAVLVFIAGVIAAVWGSTTAGWILIAVGIAMIVYAKMRS